MNVKGLTNFMRYGQRMLIINPDGSIAFRGKNKHLTENLYKNLIKKEVYTFGARDGLVLIWLKG